MVGFSFRPQVVRFCWPLAGKAPTGTSSKCVKLFATPLLTPLYILEFVFDVLGTI